MTEKTGLVGNRVRIVMRRTHPETPRETIRGIITEVDESGVRVSGRHFQEVPSAATGLIEERPLGRGTKIYWVPYNSIRYSEIITPGSISEREDNEVQRRKLLTAEEIQRRTAS